MVHPLRRLFACAPVAGLLVVLCIGASWIAVAPADAAGVPVPSGAVTKSGTPGSVAGSVSAGSDVCAIRLDSTLTCWGQASTGAGAPPGGTFVQVGVGNGFACAIRTDSTVACWGTTNTFGQATAPVSEFVTAIGVGEAHACA